MTKNSKFFLRIIPTLLLILSYVALAQSGSPSKATTPSPDIRLQDIQSAADKINNKLNSYGPYLSYLNEVAKDPGINSASMLLYYDDTFFEDSSYKKMIIFYFGSDRTLVDEYFPINNKTYVIRMKLKNATLRQDQLNIESFLYEYEQMKKIVLSKYIIIDRRLKMWIGPNSETKTIIDEKLAAEGQLLLDREQAAVGSVVMD